MKAETRDFRGWLYLYWNQFLMRFKISKEHQQFVFEEILLRYGEWHRRYHGIRHPVLLIDELRVARRDVPGWFSDPEQDAAIELAIWDHDLFYNPRATDNEERSAERALEHAHELGFPQWVGTQAKELVLATKHFRVSEGLSAQIVTAIDLSQLAAPWSDFVQDGRDIRAEQYHLSDQDFGSRQVSFLNDLLKRPRIYGTDYFHEKFEAAARENVGRSLDEQSGLLLHESGHIDLNAPSS